MRLKQLGLLSIFFIFSIASALPLDVFKEKKWSFVEYMLQKKIDGECNSISKKIKNWGISFLGFIIARGCVVKCYGHMIKNEKWLKFKYDPLVSNYSKEELGNYFANMQQFTTGCTLCLFVSLPTAFVTYRLYNRLYRDSSTYNAYIDFIRNWQDYKKVTPTELHTLFDELSEKLQNNSLTQNEIYEAIGIVNQILP